MDSGTAQPTNDDRSSASAPKPVSVPSSTGGVEREGPPIAAKEQPSSAAVETASPPERESTESKTMQHQGVVVELPPDIQTLGGGTPAAAVPVSSLPAVQLPVSDETVMRGLHANITNSLLWLASWCVRKLKKAHILLKVVQGKVIRVQE